jgi:hypothetical protein
MAALFDNQRASSDSLSLLLVPDVLLRTKPCGIHESISPKKSSAQLTHASCTILFTAALLKALGLMG